jgi:Mg2+ and Co2+ transporter CorA
MGNVNDNLWTPVPTMNSPPKARQWNSAINGFRSALKQPWRLDTTNDSPVSGDEKRLLPSSERLSPPELPPSFSTSDLDKTPDIFTFRNLQDIQHIEEKAQEAMLVLKLNTDVLEQLRLQYDELTKHGEFPQEIRDDCRASLHHFSKAVTGVKKDLRMLQSRTETLLHLLANRKSLVSNILSNSILDIGNVW